MPIARFQMPDGRVARFEVPDGTTPEDAQALFDAHLQSVSAKPEFNDRRSSGRETSRPSAKDMIAADPLVQTAVGAIDPLLGLAQRLGSGNKALGYAFPGITTAAALLKPRIDSALAKFDASATRGGASGVPRAIGNVMSPASLAATKIPLPATLSGKMGMGAGLGAMGGLLAPTPDDEVAAERALVGGLLGGAMPAVLAGGGGAFNWASKRASETKDLFRQGDEGAKNILRRYISGPRVVGKDALPSVLAATAQADEILPNGLPTVAEALVGKPGASPMSALQHLVSKTGGGPSDKFTQRLLDQDAAIEAAKTARGAASKINYGKAFDTAIHDVKADPEIAVLASNPFFKKALPSAFELAQARGINPKNNLTEFLHLVKVGLDKRLKSDPGEVALNSAQHAEVTKVKQQLVDWLARHNTDYETGRAAHATASKAIDAFKDRQQQAIAPAIKTNLGGGINIADETRQHIPNLLSRPAMLMNYLLKQAGAGVEPKIDRIAADLLLDPARFSQEMGKLPPEVQIEVAKLLRRTQGATFGGALGSTGLLGSPSEPQGLLQ